MSHPTIHPFPISLHRYHQMIAAGILTEDDQVELLNGTVSIMSPKGARHAACLRKIVDWLPDMVGKKAQVQVQDPVQIPDLSEPEPDLALVMWRDDYYAEAHPMPSDVLLIVEVADSSLRKDREAKGSVYAQAGIAEYWIINLLDSCIEVYTDPSETRYKRVRIAEIGETVVVPYLNEETPVADWLV